MTQAAAAPIDSPFSTPAAPLGSFVLLTFRILLGALFCLAAIMKLNDPQMFSEAIQAFKMVPNDWLVLFGTHAIPWIELFAGVALIFGFWTRPAAIILVGLLILFIYGVIHAIYAGQSGVPCSCFGRFKLLCKGSISWCKVAENSAMVALGLAPLAAGRAG